MERHLVEYLANACWQLPLLAAGAWLLLRMVKPSPAAQHGVWLSVLGLALLLPVHGIDRVKIVQPTHTAAAAVQTEDFSDGAFDSIGVPRGLVLGPENSVQPIFSTLQWCTRVHVVTMSASLAGWIVAIYLLTGLVGLLRIVWAWRAARRLVEGSRPVALTDDLKDAVADCSRRVGVKAPEVRESSEIAGPVVVGARKPVLLLPDEFKSCSEEELMAALCHEMAHIRRRDYLMNLICAGAAVPLKWHPATYGVERRIRSTREMVCDAVAAKAMQSEMVYAKCLLSLAKSMVAGPEMGTGADSVAAGLFNGNALEERMMRLLQGKTAMNLRAKLARGAMGGVAMVAALGLAAAFHVCLATAQAKTNQQEPTGVTGGVTGGVNGGVKGGVEGGVEGGVSAGQASSKNANGSQQSVVTDQCTRTVRVATTTPVIVRVEPGAPEVRVEPMTPVVHVVPAVNVRSVVEDMDVSPVVNISEIAPDVHVMKIAPMVRVSPITPMVRVAPAVPDWQATPPAPPAPAAPAAPPAPPASPAQAAPAAPAAPPAPAEPPAPPAPPKAKAGHSECPYSMMKLTPEERARVQKQLEEAQRKVQESMARLNSPEFRKQIEEAQQRAMEAEQKVNSAEFQKEMAAAQKRVAEAQARINSPEFRQQIEEARRKAMEADQKMNSAEFQKQMADARNELAAAQAKLNSPEFRKQIEDAQRQAADAAQKLNSGEFQKQMAEAQKKLADALAKMKAEEAAAATAK